MNVRKFLIIALALSGCSSPPQSTPVSNDLFERLTGTWGAVVDGKLDCNDVQKISFSNDRSVATFVSPHGFTNADGKVTDRIAYKVLSRKDNSLTMFLIGEARTTAGGDPIVWTLVLFQPGAFVWRQTDWPPEHFTSPRLRCDA
jgi:hypothetical protein